MGRDLFDVSGRIALVTGASSGLGDNFARLLASRGATIVAAARRTDRLAVLVADIAKAGGKAHAVALDVADPLSVTTALADIVKNVGAPDIVVNNAGIGEVGPSIDLTEEDWRRTMGTNLDGAWRVAQGSARAMLAAGKGGAIVNIASVLGLRVAPQMLAYATAKSALIQLTEVLAIEWARYNIRVNAIAPATSRPRSTRACSKPNAGRRSSSACRSNASGHPATSTARCCFSPPTPAAS